MFLHLKRLLVFSTLLTLFNAAKSVSDEISSQGNLEDPHIIKLSKFAEKKLTEHWGTDKKPVVLIKAQKQTFNGLQYNLTFAALTEDMNEYCDIAVLNGNWLRDTQLISLNCNTSLAETFKENDPVAMFINFMKKYKKVYKNRSEFNKRFLIFNANLKRIKELNELSATQPGGVVFGVTTFSDLTEEEFQQFTGSGSLSFSEPETYKPPIQIPDVPLPMEFDWRRLEVVTRVQDQGKHCQSCYTFSTTGSVEAQWAKKVGQLIDLSKQQLLDCDMNHPNGCATGGSILDTFEYIKRYGVVFESEYRYTETNGPCLLTENFHFVRIDDYTPIEQNEFKIAQWLFQNGPVSVGIDDTQFPQQYVGGIIYTPGSCNGRINHAVLIVGYGINPSDQMPFWIVKNSWGEGWGIGGYFLLARGFNQCRVSEMASTAIIYKN